MKRRNDSLQNFHDCQRLLGKFLMVGILGKRVMVSIPFSLKVNIPARTYEGSECIHRTAVLCSLLTISFYKLKKFSTPYVLIIMFFFLFLFSPYV